jgi:hypothetical protein
MEGSGGRAGKIFAKKKEKKLLTVTRSCCRYSGSSAAETERLAAGG